MSAWTCRHTDGKVVQKIVPPRPRIPYWKGLGADSEEKHEPASDIDTALVDSLNVLDPEGPIREADISAVQREVRFWALRGHEAVAQRCPFTSALRTEVGHRQMSEKVRTS